MRPRAAATAVAFVVLTSPVHEATARVLRTTESYGGEASTPLHRLTAHLGSPAFAPSSAVPVGAVAPRVVAHGARDQRRVALTFDACSTPESGYDGRIIDILVQTRAPATLFLSGKWMLRHQDQVRALAGNPLLELALHGYGHPHLVKVPPARIGEELARGAHILLALTGRRATLFRPPYAEYDDRLVRRAADFGFVTVGFDVASGDPDVRATAPRLRQWVLQATQPGSIVVMHMNGRGWHIAEALVDIITGLRDRGYELVTVGDLIRPADPDAPPLPHAWGRSDGAGSGVF